MTEAKIVRYDPFDVVVVLFPYVDRLAEKRRPALVISNRKLAAHGLIWVAMVTNADNESWPSDVEIADLRRAGCPRLRWCGQQRSRASSRRESIGKRADTI